MDKKCSGVLHYIVQTLRFTMLEGYAHSCVCVILGRITKQLGGGVLIKANLQAFKPTIAMLQWSSETLWRGCSYCRQEGIFCALSSDKEISRVPNDMFHISGLGGLASQNTGSKKKKKKVAKSENKKKMLGMQTKHILDNIKNWTVVVMMTSKSGCKGNTHFQLLALSCSYSGEKPT